MSEPDDDRDLDAFLNRQSPVSKAWREATHQDRAPEALDAAILAAAAEARPLPTRKPVPRLRRWRVPIGLAASLVVGIGVLREAQRDDLAREQLLGEQAAVAASIERREQDDARQQREFDGVREFAQKAEAERVERARPARDMLYADAPASASSDREEQRRLSPRDFSSSPPPPAAAAMLDSQPALPAPSPVPRPPAPAAKAVQAPAAEVESTVAAPGSAAPSAAAAPPPVLAMKRAAAALSGWQPARYRDLPLGQATVDDSLRRYGAPEVDTDTTSNEALLPDGRRAHRLLDYGRKLDPRGRVRLYFDAGSTALAWVNLVLDPPLSLAAVQAAEGLVGEGIARAADAPPCDAQPTPPGEPAWPQIRSWPGQGVQLLLAGPDRVVEISYLERCQ